MTSRRLALPLLLLAATTLACSAGSRGAGSRSAGPSRPGRPLPRVAILELRLETLPPALAAQLRKAVFRRLVSRSYRRVVAEEVTAARVRELGLVAGCTIGPCLRELGKQVGLERVLTGGVVAQGTSYDLVLSLIETAQGTLLRQVTARCDVCTFQELESRIQRAVDELHDW